MFSPIARFLYAAFFAACLVGCDSKPTLVPAGGTVALEGKALGLGRILFEPATKEDGLPAMGDISADGSFQLFTHKSGDGVAPGTYYPVVMDPKEEEAAPKNRRIGLIQLTDTHFEVTASGPNKFEIAITKEDVSWAVKDD